jgi:hypothetical protein
LSGKALVCQVTIFGIKTKTRRREKERRKKEERQKTKRKIKKNYFQLQRTGPEN